MAWKPRTAGRTAQRRTWRHRRRQPTGSGRCISQGYQDLMPTARAHRQCTARRCERWAQSAQVCLSGCQRRRVGPAISCVNSDWNSPRLSRHQMGERESTVHPGHRALSRGLQAWGACERGDGHLGTPHFRSRLPQRQPSCRSLVVRLPPVYALVLSPFWASSVLQKSTVFCKSPTCKRRFPVLHRRAANHSWFSSIKDAIQQSLCFFHLIWSMTVLMAVAFTL